MSFPLIGNEKTREAIERAILLFKMPHAIILCGDEGQGKKTLARYIATALVCSGRDRPCQGCKNCKMAAALSHPDIITVQREKGKREISIGQIRTVRTDAYVKPHSADGKVYIIEDADCMNIAAQNAFLKVLEEPPVGVTFILTCTSRDTLLPTVLSRTVTFNLFSPEISEAANKLCELSGMDLTSANALLKKTHGNIGAALKLSKKERETTVNDIAERFTDLVFENDSYAMLKLLNPYTKDRVFMDAFFKELSLCISARLRTVSGTGKRARVLFDLYENCKRYEKMLKTNANLPLLVSSMVASTNEQMR